ncbi:hypothetical protein EX895_001250 [Sporisorium graminicola]|uniref:Uncharacterized protein n=1 Tax=Sporisorium graminicola TaxID=280036 RepID=A0A4U7L3I0_9BASI|nr:hypothetical protein EX895_001250 [Sporisorium graminicola]TKY89952.1 hypothetical protein EX895_001250 [Sporisorium graminicola]
MSSAPPSPTTLPPPPYTELAPASKAEPPARSTSSSSSSSSSSAIATPLPSYTSSPVLRATPATTAPFTPLKLSTPTPIPTTTSHPSGSTPTAAGAGHTAHALTRTVALTLVACLGPTAVDTLWLALLNAAGMLLTLVQLPSALVLAVESHTAAHMGLRQGAGKAGVQGKQGSGTGVPAGPVDEGWMMLFTGIMWDCHDWLEEAELEPPSHWV